MISQNILNLVDAAMVGRLGSAALGAVGLAGFVNFLAMSLFIGLATGVQALVGRFIGGNRISEAAYPLNASLLLNLVIAVPLSILLVPLSDAIMRALTSEPAVIREGTPYLQTRMAAIAAMGANFSFRGFWSAVGRPGVYLRTLLAMHVLNVVLNYVLIFGKFGVPALGTLGAGLGTAIAMTVGTLSYTAIAFKKGRHYGFLRGLPSTETMGQLIRTALPASVQQFFFSAGFTVLFWIIAQIGTQELAAANAVVNLMLVAILPCVAYGITANTLVSQSLGAKRPEAAYQWGKEVVLVAMASVFVIGLPMGLWPEPILKIFLHEPEALAKAIIPLRIVGFGMIVDAVVLVLFNALQGAGLARQAMTVSLLTQWGFFLPLAWLVGPYLGYGLSAIWGVQLIYRIIQTIWVYHLWSHRDWQKHLDFGVTS